MKNVLKKSLPETLLLLLMIMNIFNCSGLKHNNEKRKLEVIKINFKKVGNGEYIGKYNLNINSASVFISIKDGVVLKIEILKHYHGPGYGADKLIEEIIKKQTLDVDAVTGATKSSYVLKKAIENALRQGL